MEPNFEGLHVIVTGGTGGLGTAVVGTLLDHGASVSIPCFKDSELEGYPHTEHDNVYTFRDVDLTDEPAVETFFKRACDDAAGQLWASIHLAGGFGMDPIEKTVAADFEHQMKTNALTAFLCCREAVRRIRATEQKPGGRIVNVAARPAVRWADGAGMVPYTMSKAAVAALTEALAAEVADEQIWVNAVAPAIMDTPANREAMPKADHSPWASVEHVASTILFLASPANHVTRGGIVPVYGRG